MKKNTNLFLIILLITHIFTQIKSMNYSENLKQKKIMPSDHPALIPDKNGICYLKKNPTEILNLIAEFLIFSEEESDNDFFKRINEEAFRTINKEENNKIYTPYGLVFINSLGSVQIQNVSSIHSNVTDDYLIQSPEDTFWNRNLNKFFGNSDKTEYRVAKIVSSKTKKQIVALVREKNNVSQTIKQTTICYIDPKNKIAQIINNNDIPKETIQVHFNNLKKISELLNNGYSRFNQSNTYEDYENPIILLAISSDGKKIAIGNANQIFLAKKNQNNNWENFICIKSFTIPEYNITNYNQIPNSTNYHCIAIDFNKQGTKLGILIGYNNFEKIIQIEPDRIKTLTDYFRQKLVCKEFMTK